MTDLIELRAQQLAHLLRTQGENGRETFNYRSVLSEYCNVKQYNQICERAREINKCQPPQ
jgi:hypothetical protein